jgi:ACS family tartrate transporter-like MFS transporter
MSEVTSPDALLKQATRSMRPLVAFLMALYFFAVLDRLNVGFAALTMNKALGLGPAQFGFGAGLFFYSYVILEIPSNILLQRFGARRWIARIVVTWGICSTATAFVTGEKSFYVVRLLLGAAEAGFFPAIIFYISRWFPPSDRARMNTLFLLGIPLSGIASSFLASACLSLDGVGGVAGWQWLFICEGVPPILCGFAVLRFLPDSPADARFLTSAQSAALATALDRDQAAVSGTFPLSVVGALFSPICLLLGVAYFGITVGLSTLGFWLPQAVASLGKNSVVVVGLMTAIPLGIGASIMLAASLSSDRRGERLWHFGAMTVLAAAGWLLFGQVSSSVARLLLIGVAAGGTYGMLSLFWTLPGTYLSGRAAAPGIAFISALGTTGAAVGPWAIGVLRRIGGDFTLAFGFVAACIAVGGMTGLLVGSHILRRYAVAVSAPKRIIAFD